MKARKVIVLAIKPEYAKKIYEGKKNWEFRKKAPPIYEEIFIYESAPVSAITGKIVFSTAITGWGLDVWELVLKNQCFTRNLPGISAYELQYYSKGKLVTALRVYKAEKFDSPEPFPLNPPQNWGHYPIEEAK
ncbi:MAG: hypothetical protein IJQ34_00700 [Kiritimatiellae bacterium]|nr:hypothetical protein [Kiritimatiellia bacterium]